MPTDTLKVLGVNYAITLGWALEWVPILLQCILTLLSIVYMCGKIFYQKRSNEEN